jgi:ABC-type transport system involved in cytochrome c biogenesis permease component
MNSIWAEAVGIFRKDLRIELRNNTGFWTSTIYAVAVMSAIGFATQKEKPGPELSAGILTAVLMITALSALPRVLLNEDELGTFDLLRLRFSPEGIYWGKWLYVVGLQLANATVLGGLYLLFTGTNVVRWEFLVLGLFLESLSVSCSRSRQGVSVCFATRSERGCQGRQRSTRWPFRAMRLSPRSRGQFSRAVFGNAISLLSQPNFFGARRLAAAFLAGRTSSPRKYYLNLRSGYEPD